MTGEHCRHLNSLHRLKADLESQPQQSFQLNRVPLMRLALFQLSESQASCVWTLDRALLDRRSFAILIKEVFAFYDAFYQRQDLQIKQPRPDRDYIQWLQPQDFSTAPNFWRELLRSFSTTTPRRQSSSHKNQPARCIINPCQCLRKAIN
ncbi:MAG: condensation domain-containing protein [Oscillatoria sp. Prado101]|jgi:hypothetical protein|nr:condensation domain-containing protein [Oscillatoria sp. Prado101]